MPPSAKLLYVMAQVSNVKSLTELAELTGVGIRTAYRMSRLLRKNKWVKPVRKGRNVIPVPVLPATVDQERVQGLKARFGMAPHKGQFLCWEYLDLIVADADEADNVRPDFLENPLTGAKMEFDRYYPARKVAFEFNGPQHSRPTVAYPDVEEQKQQRARDLMKRGHGQEQGIKVVTLTYADLSLEGMPAKIPEEMPRRVVDPASKYTRTLEALAAGYRKWAARLKADEGDPSTVE